MELMLERLVKTTECCLGVAHVLGSENISVTKTEKKLATLEFSFLWKKKQVTSKSAQNIIHSRNLCF